MKLVVLVSSFLFCVCSAANGVRWPYCGSRAFLTAPNGTTNTISSHEGMVHGHHYGKNMDCHWTIEAPAGMYVEIWEKTFDLELSTGCRYDYLEIFDGNSTSSRSMGKFCGSTLPTLTSTQSFLTLCFFTNSRTQMAGFKIAYNYTSTVIKFCSPSMLTCINGNCVTTRSRCNRIDDCGDNSDEQGCVGETVKPGTGHTGGHTGACGVDKFRCANANCINKDWLCDGDDDCRDGSDEVPARCTSFGALHSPLPVNADGCGERTNGTAGAISSPNFPSDYTSDKICTWIIRAPNGTHRISFRFAASFSIEDDLRCAYDYVVIAEDRQMRIDTHGTFPSVHDLVVERTNIPIQATSPMSLSKSVIRLRCS